MSMWGLKVGKKEQRVEVHGTSGMDSKPIESKPVKYNNSKYDQYNLRRK